MKKKATPAKKKAAVKKAANPVNDIITAFGKLEPKERVDLHKRLQEAINHDTDLLSQGQEVGSDHYDSLIMTEENNIEQKNE